MPRSAQQINGDPSELRERMVSEQLAARGISDPRVLASMRHVPREEFVLPAYRHAAYADGALPIEAEQTISQPFTVAFMCEEAQLQPDDRVLEIGTGSGYGAAVLSELCDELHTVERIALLANQSADRLRRLKYDNVHVHEGDGSQGWPGAAPYMDRICSGSWAISKASLA